MSLQPHFPIVVLLISAILNNGFGQPDNRFYAQAPKNRKILEHTASGKCLTISQDYKLRLENCNFELESPSISGVFQVIKSNRGGHLLRWATTTLRISGAVAGCLGVQNNSQVTSDPERDDEEGRKLELLLGPCDTRDPSFNWEFREIDDEKHLLRKFPFGPCVIPTAHDIGALVKTVPCNAKDPEQAWTVCDSLGVGKCEVVEAIDKIFF